MTLTINEVAKRLGVSASHVRKLIALKELPATNVGTPGRRIWRIRPEDLDGWIESRSSAA